MSKIKKMKNGGAKIKCAHCGHKWLLGAATSSRCPKCTWITEVYFDESDASKVAEIYNEQEPPARESEKAKFARLIGINGYAVVFMDQGRLAEVADKILASEKR